MPYKDVFPLQRLGCNLLETPQPLVRSTVIRVIANQILAVSRQTWLLRCWISGSVPSNHLSCIEHNNNQNIHNFWLTNQNEKLQTSPAKHYGYYGDEIKINKNETIFAPNRHTFLEMSPIATEPFSLHFHSRWVFLQKQTNFHWHRSTYTAKCSVHTAHYLPQSQWATHRLSKSRSLLSPKFTQTTAAFTPELFDLIGFAASVLCRLMRSAKR